jgi:hypothetical protein
MKNPALREAPREQLAPIMESRKDASILGWLEGTGRLMDRDLHERPLTHDEEMEEINALMLGDDTPFEEDDDDEL